MSKLDEIILRVSLPDEDGAKALWPMEAKRQIKALFAETMSKAWLALDNDEKDVYIYRDVLRTMIDEL